jgi:hypothetical protein
VEYPHHRYITFLLSKRLAPFEIRADCLARGLMPPSDEALEQFSKVLEPWPKYWRITATRGNTAFRRWLRDKGLSSLWNRDEAAEQAFRFLRFQAARKDFEAIILVHGNVEQAREELLIKYPKAVVPSLKALNYYYDFFWDVGSLSSEGLMEHLEASVGKEDYLPAARGDVVSAYATLGLQQRVGYEQLLQEMVDGGFAMMRRIRKDSANISGQNAAGLMTVVMGGVKAAEELRQIHAADHGETGIRQEAAEFMHRRLVQTHDIPSIDELDGEYIDAEYVEAGADNVFTLPSRD